MKDIPLKQLEEEIPKGYYCYTADDFYTDDQGGQHINRQVCKYWSNHPEHGEQNSGHCSYLELGDWMEVDENSWKKEDGDIYYMGLLWDQVKGCGINEFTDEEKQEMVREVKKENRLED